MNSILDLYDLLSSLTDETNEILPESFPRSLIESMDDLCTEIGRYLEHANKS